MKILFALTAGLIISVSALSSNTFTLPPSPEMTAEEIEQEMDRKFELRDTFKEKGNSLKYIKVHH